MEECCIMSRKNGQNGEEQREGRFWDDCTVATVPLNNYTHEEELQHNEESRDSSRWLR